MNYNFMTTIIFTELVTYFLLSTLGGVICYPFRSRRKACPWARLTVSGSWPGRSEAEIGIRILTLRTPTSMWPTSVGHPGNRRARTHRDPWRSWAPTFSRMPVTSVNWSRRWRSDPRNRRISPISPSTRSNTGILRIWIPSYRSSRRRRWRIIGRRESPRWIVWSATSSHGA